MNIDNEENVNQESQQSNDQAPETHENVSHETNHEDLVDLARYNRVKLGDREMTRQELERGHMMHSDYTKKTQELAQERKYIDNLSADLKKIASNPALATEFKRIYPSKYHGYLDLVQQSRSTSQGTSQQAQSPSEIQRLSQELMQVQNVIRMYEQQSHEERVKQSTTEIDSAFAKYQSKYPLSTPRDPKTGYADESRILNAAQAVIDSGEPLNDKAWEKIFKSSHAFYEAAFKGHYKQTANSQKAANARGKDIGSGGGIPGNAPNLPRTIKDATKAALQDLTSKH